MLAKSAQSVSDCTHSATSGHCGFSTPGGELRLAGVPLPVERQELAALGVHHSHLGIVLLDAANSAAQGEQVMAGRGWRRVPSST